MVLFCFEKFTTAIDIKIVLVVRMYLSNYRCIAMTKLDLSFVMYTSDLLYFHNVGSSVLGKLLIFQFFFFFLVIII